LEIVVVSLEIARAFQNCRILCGGMGEWLKPAVLKTTLAFLHTPQIIEKSG
jgi:hypothetical protein